MSKTSLTVMSQPSCVQCTATYRALDKKGLPYESIDMTVDAEAHALAKSFGYMQAPVVVVRDEAGTVLEHWSGMRPDKISAYAQSLATVEPELLAA
ncbi:glutaredoxin domain-containing protein [Tersicoccus sp. MR15.9]|uniref:glutaredoxin domain-containing protein n=1 Tax=Tersicoccus mangrovi TaxID=3121635 RepID=UPI002FE5A65B